MLKRLLIGVAVLVAIYGAQHLFMGDELDIPALEAEIESGVLEQTGQRLTVDCPDSIDWETGEEFHCIAESRQGQRGRVTVTMENDEGEVIWELQPL